MVGICRTSHAVYSGRDRPVDLRLPGHDTRAAATVRAISRATVSVLYLTLTGGQNSMVYTAVFKSHVPGQGPAVGGKTPQLSRTAKVCLPEHRLRVVGFIELTNSIHLAYAPPGCQEPYISGIRNLQASCNAVLMREP